VEKTLVTKSEVVIAGSLAGRSFSGRPGPTQGCRANDDDDDDDYVRKNPITYIIHNYT
jgi:hypothetical protein